jgi:hypothetical protein
MLKVENGAKAREVCPRGVSPGGKNKCPISVSVILEAAMAGDILERLAISSERSERAVSEGFCLNNHLLIWR